MFPLGEVMASPIYNSVVKKHLCSNKPVEGVEYNTWCAFKLIKDKDEYEESCYLCPNKFQWKS